MTRIDSGATGNFMFKKFAKNNYIPELLQEKPYQLTVVDRTSLNQDERMVKKETLPLRTQISGKNLGRIIFDLVSIPHEAILRIPWLEKTNPSINWHTQRVNLGRKNPGKPIPQHEKTHTVKVCKIS